jgi:hypothetical protein
VLYCPDFTDEKTEAQRLSDSTKVTQPINSRVRTQNQQFHFFFPFFLAVLEFELSELAKQLEHTSSPPITDVYIVFSDYLYGSLEMHF